jgi:hypothetical protein
MTETCRLNEHAYDEDFQDSKLSLSHRINEHAYDEDFQDCKFSLSPAHTHTNVYLFILISKQIDRYIR